MRPFSVCVTIVVMRVSSKLKFVILRGIHYVNYHEERRTYTCYFLAAMVAYGSKTAGIKRRFFCIRKVKKSLSTLKINILPESAAKATKKKLVVTIKLVTN